MRLDHLLSKEERGNRSRVSEKLRDYEDCSIFKVPMRKGTLKEENGGLAQLGEHLLCKQGVKGSIPLISTRRGLIAQLVRALG